MPTGATRPARRILPAVSGPIQATTKSRRTAPAKWGLPSASSNAVPSRCAADPGGQHCNGKAPGNARAMKIVRGAVRATVKERLEFHLVGSDMLAATVDVEHRTSDIAGCRGGQVNGQALEFREFSGSFHC